MAYRLESAEGEPDGLLSARAALALNASDTPAERESDVPGDPLHLVRERCVLPYRGARGIERRTFGPVAGSEAALRERWPVDVEALGVDCFGAGTARR